RQHSQYPSHTYFIIINSCILNTLRTPRSPLFPYTTLFRSRLNSAVVPAASSYARNSLPSSLTRSVPSRKVSPGRMIAAICVRKRSEEHTSELQSLTNIVCRLLLEINNQVTFEVHNLLCLIT